MKTKFYNTHTEVDDIKDLDGNWLKKQLADRPFDVQYQYLKALLSMSKGKQTSYIKSIGKLLFDTNGAIRIGALLQRSEDLEETADNVLDSVSIKSKKSVKTIQNSAILAGLTEVNPELYKKKSKKKGKRKKKGVLEVDMITVEDDEYIDEAQSFQNNDEEEEEEYVSASIPDNSIELVTQETQTRSTQPRATDSKALTRSEMVEIEHSAFTTWLQSLPSIVEEDIDDTTTESNAQAISEPLARLLGTQGHKADAIVMYQQLMLKYPEKSSFFADQIKKLS